MVLADLCFRLKPSDMVLLNCLFWGFGAVVLSRVVIEGMKPFELLAVGS